MATLEKARAIWLFSLFKAHDANTIPNVDLCAEF
jgi:hypothetical protein